MEGVVRLMPCQTADPSRGSFMVHPLPVKDSKRKVKEVVVGTDADGTPIKATVFRAANHIVRKPDGSIVRTIPHPEAFEFVQVR